MKKSLILLIAICFLALTGQAMAYSISLTPASQTIGMGETAATSVNLSITGQEQLFGFNFGLTFDPGILNFKNLSFGSALSDYLTGFTPPSAGSPGLVTFDGALDLFSTTGLSEGTYTLANLFFDGSGAGAGTQTLSGDVLDMAPESRLVPLNAAADVTVTPVPEPGIMVLFGVSMAGLAAFRRKCA